MTHPTSPVRPDELADRIRGVLFGQAIGDALGVSTESGQLRGNLIVPSPATAPTPTSLP